VAAKVACCHVKEAATALLATRQLGFGIPGGAEAVVRSARVYMDNISSGNYSLKLTFAMHSTRCVVIVYLKQ